MNANRLSGVDTHAAEPVFSFRGVVLFPNEIEGQTDSLGKKTGQISGLSYLPGGRRDL